MHIIHVDRADSTGQVGFLLCTITYDNDFLEGLLVFFQLHSATRSNGHRHIADIGNGNLLTLGNGKLVVTVHVGNSGGLLTLYRYRSTNDGFAELVEHGTCHRLLSQG